jgi:hypothetical protein
MPNGGVVYSFDTSAFMDWQARYYPTDVFLSLVKRIDRSSVIRTPSGCRSRSG